jgi:hypothetical protein
MLKEGFDLGEDNASADRWLQMAIELRLSWYCPAAESTKRFKCADDD